MSKRIVSAATRKKLSQAQRMRWAMLKGGERSVTVQPTETGTKGKKVHELTNTKPINLAAEREQMIIEHCLAVADRLNAAGKLELASQLLYDVKKEKAG